MSVERYLASSNAQAPKRLSSRLAELSLVGGVVMIFALIILPMPAFVIDLLVGANITFGVTLLITTLYIRSALDFSSFPSILLISTLFRLALSIATTRMILLQGHAGDIIQTFGKTVVGGNLVVGLVVFLIITIVQFIVIAKGAERVAEVAARFSLDSMPGKQLSIDSDLRSGLIDKDEARRRRRILEQESKLHGSLDGAMKFVKGDAIASIVIVVVNLIGGLAIGVMQQGMDMAAATHKYSVLSIGEGLVAQIPALLGAMAAGLIVTRAADEDETGSLGDTIHRQIAANPRVLIFVGAISLLLALVPGFPSMVFVVLGLSAGISGALTHPRLRPQILRRAGPLQKVLLRGKPAPMPATLLAAPRPQRAVVPLLLEMRGQLPAEAVARGMADGFAAIMEAIQHRSGVPLPKLAIHLDAGEEPAHWRLLAYEIPIGEGDGLDGPTMADAIARLLRRNLAMFLGVQETMTLIHSVGEQYPEVVKEAVRALPGPKLAEVMRRLADEEVPLRNMRDVLEGVADAASQEREPARVAELTRVALKRYLLDAYVVDGVLRTLTVSPELEALVKGATRMLDGVEHLALQPEVAQALVETIGNTAGEADARVVVTSSEVRRALRRLIEPVLFDLPVLSFNELSPMVRMEVVGQIGLPSRAMVGKDTPAIAAE